MKRYVQFEPFIIEDFETDNWNHPRHRHNHFEFICIMKGKGKHTINDLEMNYGSGDLFLLHPEDIHQFDVTSVTRFVYFKFTQLYLTQNAFRLPEHWNRDIDLLLRQSHTQPGSLVRSGHDIELVRSLMEMISMEYKQSDKGYREIIYQLFSVILNLIRRNSLHSKSHSNAITGSKIDTILYYIESHIHEPQALSTQKIADEVYVSQDYLGTYFKRNMGITLSDYLSEYRFKLIKLRLRYSTDTLKKIAADFGFFDSSHLNKFFKSHTGHSPSEYRATMEATD